MFTLPISIYFYHISSYLYFYFFHSWITLLYYSIYYFIPPFVYLLYFINFNTVYHTHFYFIFLPYTLRFILYFILLCFAFLFTDLPIPLLTLPNATLLPYELIISSVFIFITSDLYSTTFLYIFTSYILSVFFIIIH